MKAIVFIFNSETSQRESKVLVLDVKYLTLGFDYVVNVEQKVNESLDYPVVIAGGKKFPLYKELGAADILKEIRF